MQVVYATANPAVTASIWPIFRGGDITLRDLTELERQQVPENGATLKENAIAKAMEVAKFRGGFVISQDTGFYVDALGGLPGASPTCWTGKKAPLKHIEEKLLELMRQTTRTEHRTAMFRSVVAVVTPDRKIRTFTGELRGHVVKRPRGYHMVSPFPYDRVFMPESEGKVLTELSPERRAQITHRGKAMQQAREYIMKVRDHYEY